MNPEFQRYLQLEFSLARIVVMPTFLGIIFSLIYVLDGNGYQKTIANTALIFYTLIVLFWGAKQAANSLFEEINNHTWDIQKTSAISAWSLTWGKLLGSTLYNWYGGFICLAIYSYMTPEPFFTPLIWVYFISAGIFAQSSGLLMSLLSLRSERNLNSSFSYLFILLSLFLFSTLLFNYLSFLRSTAHWYGHSYNEANFISISLCLACGWCIIGIYRLIAEALRIRSLPWVWIAFIVFSTTYTIGFFIFEEFFKKDITHLIIGASFIILSTSGYILLFLDENNPMLARRLWIYAQQQKWQRFIQEIPCWVISLSLALPCAFLLTLFSSFENIEEITPIPLVIYFLIIRDASLLLYFNYALNPKNATGLTLLYLVCLYFLFPVILFNLEFKLLAEFVLPLLDENIISASIIAALQAFFVIFLLFSRWKKRMNQMDC